MLAEHFHRRYKSCAFLSMIIWLILVTGCTKNQNDVNLPVYHSIGGDFTLPSTLGRDLTLSDYQGKVILLNFGYTFCPDICPTVLGQLAKLAKKLEQKNGIDSSQLQILFISVDPDRDTLDVLKEYLAFFNINFIGIRGTGLQTAEVAKNYAVYFEKLTEENLDYQMAHTDKIFLLDKRGRARGFYDISAADDKLKNDIVSLAEADL